MKRYTISNCVYVRHTCANEISHKQHYRKQLSAAWYVTLLEIQHLLSSFLQSGSSCI